MHHLLFVAAALTAFSQSASGQVPAFDLNDVPLSTRQTWCTSQIAACPLICLQEEGNTAATYANTCDAASLSYSCICSNGIAPNASEYSQTIPYYVCTENNNVCRASCGTNGDCAAACVTNNPCGAQNPERVNTSTISTMPATTTTQGNAASTASDGEVVYTGFGDSTATAAAGESTGSSDTSAASKVMLQFGQVYGLGVVAAGIFAGFAFML